MSIRTLKPPHVRTPYFRPAIFPHMVPKRHLHRSLDLKYLELWKKNGVDYSQAIDPVTRRNLHQSPALVERILRASTAATLQGRVAFIHAIPASALVLMRIYQSVYPWKKEYHPFFHYLRSPIGKEGTASLEQAKSWVPQKDE